MLFGKYRWAGPGSGWQSDCGGGNGRAAAAALLPRKRRPGRGRVVALPHSSLFVTLNGRWLNHMGWGRAGVRAGGRAARQILPRHCYRCGDAAAERPCCREKSGSEAYFVLCYMSLRHAPKYQWLAFGADGASSSPQKYGQTLKMAPKEEEKK